ncbi:uncharacterized protein LOC111267137 [Varroa jacobsoni]|uniref:uncharacterized protein LOC111267137 n=1 Tax=Varroa jacobsoni TaxID=62625 RepID=UPI000BF8B8F1|nr:uncharacterized protein LOC111267137 [Varroa jacobsoni]
MRLLYQVRSESNLLVDGAYQMNLSIKELNADSRIGRPLEKQQITLKAHAETSGSVLPQLNNLNLNNSRVQNKLQNQDFRTPSTVSPNTIAADRYQFQFLGPNSTTHEINDPDLNVQKGKLRRNFALKEVRFRMDKWINQEAKRIHCNKIGAEVKWQQENYCEKQGHSIQNRPLSSYQSLPNLSNIADTESERNLASDIGQAYHLHMKVSHRINLWEQRIHSSNF